MSIVNLNRKKMIFVLVSTLVLCILLTGLWPVEVLIIGGDKTESSFFKVSEGEKIYLSFLHSRYKVQQEEIYLIEKSQMVLTSVFFGDFSAADYYDPKNSLYQLTHVNEGYEIKKMRYVVPSIQFAIAHGTQYTLNIGSLPPIDLNTSFKESNFISIKIEEEPRVMLVLRNLSLGN